MGDATGSAPPSGVLALLIVGPGVLGAYLGKLWAEDHPDATVTGQTNSTTNHHRHAPTPSVLGVLVALLAGYLSCFA